MSGASQFAQAEVVRMPTGLVPALGVCAKTLSCSCQRFLRVFPLLVAGVAILLGGFALGTVVHHQGHQTAGAVVLTLTVLALVYGASVFWRKQTVYECAHAALITELIVGASVPSAAESELARGMRLAAQRLGKVDRFYEFRQKSTRIFLDLFYVTLRLSGEPAHHEEPAPRRLLFMVLRYVDWGVLSYLLARPERSLEQASFEALCLAGQHKSRLIKTSVWAFTLEWLLALPLWLLVMPPCVMGAFALTYGYLDGDWQLLRQLTPQLFVEHLQLFLWAIAAGLGAGLGLAYLLVQTLRTAFIAPLGMALMALEFQRLAATEPADPRWSERLREAGDLLEEFSWWAPR